MTDTSLQGKSAAAQLRLMRQRGMLAGRSCAPKEAGDDSPHGAGGEEGLGQQGM